MRITIIKINLDRQYVSLLKTHNDKIHTFCYRQRWPTVILRKIIPEIELRIKLIIINYRQTFVCICRHHMANSNRVHVGSTTDTQTTPPSTPIYEEIQGPNTASAVVQSEATAPVGDKARAKATAKDGTGY